MKKLTLALVAVLALTLAIPAMAQQQRHPELDKFKATGGQVEYLGKTLGMDGWLLLDKDGQNPRFAYTTPDGGMVIGILVGPDGTVETQKQLVAWRARAQGDQGAMPGAAEATIAPKTERLYAQFEKSNWIKMGAADAPYIYVLVNTDCDHCQNFWHDLQPAIAGGKLQVRLIPFGIGDTNRNGGAALLAADDPAAAWNAYIAGDKAVLGADKATAETLAAVDANTKLFTEWKLPTPPFTLYRRLTDGAVTAIAGRPQNLLLLLADVTKGN